MTENENIITKKYYENSTIQYFYKNVGVVEIYILEYMILIVNMIY